MGEYIVHLVQQQLKLLHKLGNLLRPKTIAVGTWQKGIVALADILIM